MQTVLPTKLPCVLVSSSCCENSSVVIHDLTYESHTWHVKPIQTVGTMCIRVAYSEVESTKVRDCQICVCVGFGGGKIVSYPVWTPPPPVHFCILVSHGII